MLFAQKSAMAATAHPESGLEVVPSHAPIYMAPDHSGLQHYQSSAFHSHYASQDQAYGGSDWANDQKGHDFGASAQGNKRRICGLRGTIFWLLLTLALLIVVAAVGGGLGAALAKKPNHDGDGASIVKTSTVSSFPTIATSSSSNTISSTRPSTSLTATPTGITSFASVSSSTTTYSAVTSGETGLAAFSCKDGQSYTASSGSQYRAFCQKDLLQNFVLQRLTVYSFQDCIDACGAYNQNGTCGALTYNANLTSIIGGGQGGDCFLKDQMGTVFEGADYSASAVLEL